MMIPDLTNLTRDQIKRAALKMLRSVFGKVNEPREVRITDHNVLLVFAESDGSGMEHYFFDDGEEFAFSKSKDGEIAVVNIYSMR